MRSYLILLVGAALVGSLLANDFFPSLARISVQHLERRIEKKRMPSQPGKITEVKNKKLKFSDEGVVVDDDEWLDGLTVEVKNTSGKAITFIEVALDFPRGENDDPRLPAPLVFPLRYGTREKPDGTTDRPSVKPSETVRLTLSDEEYALLKYHLSNLYYPQSIKKVDITLRTVIFEDDIRWDIGSTMIRDPDNPDRWIIIKQPEVISPANGEAVKKN